MFCATDGRLAPDNSGGCSSLMVKSVTIVRCLFKPHVRKNCEAVEMGLHSFLISVVDGGEIYAAAVLPARKVQGTRVQRGLGVPQSWSERCSEERTVVHVSRIERWSASSWVRHDRRKPPVPRLA
jgi:hypothetical protein